MTNNCLYCGRGCMGEVCGDPQCVEQSLRDTSYMYYCLDKEIERQEDEFDKGIDDVLEENYG